ncbi:hypothetical protein BLS_009164 [Venturia inaequalis]|uniref:Uncharacterized protein n=1 Tax=Venturia inaequalis TaxID=5025 RepID=A0A8H3YZL5_VENIN|nr:hypothetical protein BLS_009164 [Venturia inaequalis]KAE9980214.1 hypothetical protein EG328_000448 [Venturia inaequalis]KAE9991790.1 hypothetical protein EG327_010986 [Venturia inaequalis]RDI89583.1 hypothetical protein Vi05172_g711 [Venturia inaequalis]
MRLLPNEWEGTTPLLPRSHDIHLPVSSVLDNVMIFSVIGVSYGLGKKAFTKVFWRKYYQQLPQQPYPVWRTIGGITVLATLWASTNQVLRRQLKKREANLILQDAGIPMPKFRLWEHTKKLTRDDISLAVGFSTIMSSLALQRSRPTKMSGLAILGQATISMSLGRAGFMLWNSKEITLTSHQCRAEMAAAARSYTAQTGKPPPRALYGTYEGLGPSTLGMAFEGNALTGQQSGQSAIPFSATSSASSALGTPQPFDFADGIVMEPQPHGSHPHHCILVNGSLVFGSTRDYFWEPDSVEAGIEALKEHIEKLKEKRTRLAQEAAFLFQEVAQRENKYLAMDNAERDTEAGRRWRKAMELLSSMHFNTYSEIAETDWLISDSKKMILQLETNGTWMPPNQGPPDSKALGTILDKVREHVKKTEMLLQQISYMVVPPENREQMEENTREIKENSEATADLIEYFEEASKPK